MFLVDHMFALFFRFLLDFPLLFLNPFENPFSLLSATQILRADRLISVSPRSLYHPDKLEFVHFNIFWFA